MENPEDEDRLVEQMDDEEVQDEGFLEEEPIDLTVPVLYDTIETVPQPSTSSQGLPPPKSPSQRRVPSPLQRPLQHPDEPSAASDPATSAGSSAADQTLAPILGPDGVPGWDKVQDLAEYLVSLRQARYLDEQQVSEVILLWTALPEGDKRRIHYQPRHQPKLVHGRYKAPKNAGTTPGVDSVKKCLIGHPGGPAQWPSSSRLVETMCVKLCALHKSPSKKDGVRLPRWTKVLNDYHHIRDVVLNCHTLMEATSLQLFLLNQRTLTQWFNRRENSQERSVLSQGLACEDRIAVASSQLPAPRERMEKPPSTSGPQHEFVLPPNRAGQAPKLRPGRQPASATVVRPIAPAHPPAPLALPAPALPPQIIVLNPGWSLAAPVQAQTPVAPVAPVSRLTVRNKRRRAEQEASGVQKRRYVREVAVNKCSKCGQPKIKEFGHSRFGRATFCLNSSGGKSLEVWLNEQRQQKELRNPPP
ncbi:uncharacterized protein LOC130919501 [Corythoichthys intestinalis]|uniref:uncharacterized protein LOC130919501 n=1 Tax=Corythoichthys intestinalis TaxID=161448 RepID=UPI0025A5D369|nr:uncharacterized protein LOC130919501 [Corythoichthys intestinalis]